MIQRPLFAMTSASITMLTDLTLNHRVTGTRLDLINWEDQLNNFKFSFSGITKENKIKSLQALYLFKF